MGSVTNWAENNVYGVETFYQIRINDLVHQLQHMIASTALSRYVREFCGSRCEVVEPTSVKQTYVKVRHWFGVKHQYR